MRFPAALPSIALSAIMVATVAAADERPVPLANPGFEDGTEGWSWWASPPDVVQVRVIPSRDGHCVQFLAPASSAAEPGDPEAGERPDPESLRNLRVAFYQRVPVMPQTHYRIRFRYRAGPRDVGGGIFGNLSTRLIDANGKHFDYPCSMALLDTFGRWLTGEAQLYTPLSCATVQVEFNSQGACDLRIDDVRVAAIDPPADSEPNTWQALTGRRDERLWYSSWQYILRPEKYRQRAMKYGWRYRYEEQFDMLAETHTTTWTVDEQGLEEFAERGIPACDYPYYRAQELYEDRLQDTEAPDVPRILSPTWHDCQVEACRQLIAEHAESPGIAYIFAGDEVFGRYLKALKPADERESALWSEIEADVRERFGGGVHGLPESREDTNPYRWIAYLRWACDQFMGTLRAFRRVIDDSGCGAELLGPDEAMTVYPWPWAEMAEVVDIFTGQSLPYRRTAHTYNTGYVTKCYRDFTGRPVHNATQIVMYAGSPSPEEVRRRFSQVLQSGGEGQMLIAEEWGDRDLSHHQYSAPARWETVKNLLRMMQTHRARTPDDSSVGILYSSPSMMGMGPRVDDTPVETAYAICGPILGSWPRMIDSRALVDDDGPLAGLHMLIVPYAPIERPAVVQRLTAFVRAGGLLVCCDPTAFGRDPMGRPLHGRELLGVRVWRSKPLRSIQMRWPADGRQRVYAFDCFGLQAVRQHVTTAATTPDGEPAAAMHELGEGRVLTFGCNPLVDGNAADDDQCVAWWRSMLAHAAVPLNLAIWRLRLPDSALVHAEPPEDVCVTGNSFVRVQNGVYLGANAPQGGHYTMSVEPDLSPECAADRPVPFEGGDLTDRTEADLGPFGSMRIPKEPYEESDWANRWSAVSLADGLDIELMLPEPRQLTRLRFWFSGTMPALEVLGDGDDGWTTLGRAQRLDVGADVEQVTVALAGAHRSVRMLFAPDRGEFALADVELWARASGEEPR